MTLNGHLFADVTPTASRAEEFWCRTLFCKGGGKYRHIWKLTYTYLHQDKIFLKFKNSVMMAKNKDGQVNRLIHIWAFNNQSYKNTETTAKLMRRVRIYWFLILCKKCGSQDKCQSVLNVCKWRWRDTESPAGEEKILRMVALCSSRDWWSARGLRGTGSTPLCVFYKPTWQMNSCFDSP